MATYKEIEAANKQLNTVDIKGKQYNANKWILKLARLKIAGTKAYERAYVITSKNVLKAATVNLWRLVVQITVKLE